MRKRNIRKSFLSILMAFAFVIAQLSGFTPTIKAHATDLAKPENVKWKENALATAEWDQVEGADYYVLSVKVYNNGVLQGSTETGTSSTETDLQQQIRNLAPEGVDQVSATFCVKAKNTLEGLESEYSDNSIEITYYLNAFDTLDAPTDVNLSDCGVLSFKMAEGTDHFIITCSAVGSSVGIGGETSIDEGTIQDGYFYLDISEGLKHYYISRGHVGETIRFSAQVKTVSSDGRSSEWSEQSNVIDYLIESTLTTPTFVSLQQENDQYVYTFENDGVAQYYEFEFYMSRFFSRNTKEEVSGTSYKPNLQTIRIDPSSYDSFKYLESGLYRLDILDILRYYLYSDWEPDPDYSVDIGIRLRSVVGDEVSEFSSAYLLENFQVEALMEEIESPVIEKNVDKYIISFEKIDGAQGYDVRFNYYNPWLIGAMFFSYSNNQCSFDDGTCYIDITELYNEHIRSLAQDENEVSFCVFVRAYGDKWGKYEIGTFSKESNSFVIEPYGVPVESIILSPSNPILAVGNSLYLGKTVTPANGYYENIEWSSDNEDVVKVNGEGCITGISTGSAIVAAIVDNSVRTEVKVNTYEIQSNIENQEEAAFVEGVSGDIIDDIGNNENPDLSNTDISESDLEDIKDEIHTGIENGDTFHTDIVSIKQTFETYKNSWGQIQKAARNLNAQFAGAYNIEVEMYHKDKNDTNYHIGNITELENEITFTLDLVGNTKKYVLVRVHKNANGEEEYESIDFTVNEDGTLTVKSDKFSDFILCTVPDEEELSAVSNIHWVADSSATLAWDAVEGADYYAVTVEVYELDGTTLIGSTETGTASTELDVQQEINAVIAETEYTDVKAKCCVTAKRTLSDGEYIQASLPTYSEAMEYLLPIGLEPPTNLVLDQETYDLSFNAVSGATNYELVWCGGGYGGGTYTFSEESGVVKGNILDFIKFWYYYENNAGKEINAYVNVIAYDADGNKSNISKPSNSISYYGDPLVESPKNLYLNAETYELTFDAVAGATKYELVWCGGGYGGGTYTFSEENGVVKGDISDFLKYWYYYQNYAGEEISAYVNVIAYDADGNKSNTSKASNSISYYGDPLVESPKNLYLNAETYELTFDAVSGATKYELVWCGGGYGGGSYTFSEEKGVVNGDISDFIKYWYYYENNAGKEINAYVNVIAYDASGNHSNISEPSNTIVYCNYVLVESIALSPELPYCCVGRSIYLGKTITPINAYYESIEWIADDPEVVVVDSTGKITGVSVGTAIITAKIGEVSSSVLVTVYEVSSNIADETENGKVTDTAGDIIDEIMNTENPEISNTDINPENVKDIKEEIAEAIENGDSFHTDIVSIQQTFETYKNNWGQIQKAAKNLNAHFAGAYNIEVEMYHKDNNDTDHHIGNITELENEVTFTIDLVGNSKKYVLVRVHKNADGEEEYESIDFTVNEDGTLTVKSDKFSDFVILSLDGTSEYNPGDVDGDGVINAKDVTMLRRHLAGGWSVTVNLVNSDVNGDGTINAKDVTILRRYLAGGWGVILGKQD